MTRSRQKVTGAIVALVLCLVVAAPGFALVPGSGRAGAASRRADVRAQAALAVPSIPAVSVPARATTIATPASRATSTARTGTAFRTSQASAARLRSFEQLRGLPVDEAMSPSRQPSGIVAGGAQVTARQARGKVSTRRARAQAAARRARETAPAPRPDAHRPLAKPAAAARRDADGPARHAPAVRTASRATPSRRQSGVRRASSARTSAVLAGSRAIRHPASTERRPAPTPKPRPKPQPKPSPSAPIAFARVVVGLGPLFTTQFDGSRYAASNCSMASGAMLFEVQTGRDVTGAQLRRWSGATSQATTIWDLQRAFAKAGQRLYASEDLPWRVFTRSVRSGRSAVVLGWYGQLPRRYVLQAGFRGAHSVFVLGYSPHALGGRGGFYVMDPLGRPGYGGAWWTAAALHAFGWSGSPGHRGSGPRAFFGNVAMQATPTHKHLGTRGDRPTFRSYWATAKQLLTEARKVTVQARPTRELGPNLKGAVLRIQDPKLKMTPAKARRRHQLRWPVGGHRTIAAGYTRRHRSLDIRAPKGAHAVAAAPGRVLYRSYRRGHAADSVWMVHGRRLVTQYANLTDVRVRPGQWVKRGQVLGSLAAAGKGRSSLLRLKVVVSDHPFSNSGRVDPLHYLHPGARRAP